MTIYVSTGGVSTAPACKTASQWMQQGLHAIELSGGLYSANMEAELITLRDRGAKLSLHNYFPPPKDPFVFNLASLDPVIGAKSEEHVREAVRLSRLVGAGYFSFHAGFLIDPKPSELGASLASQTLSDRNRAMETFVDRVRGLADFAGQCGITLLVENNVITRKNFDAFGENPLFMTTPDEIDNVMRLLPASVGLLLDTGHLKVSAKTMGFSEKEAFLLCSRWIRGYHLSDNDGVTDSNGPITAAAWFMGLLRKEVSYISVEVYGASAVDLLSQVELVRLNLS